MNGYDIIYDVIVCGGGTSGFAAAIAAARNGANTLLIEKSGVIGGQLTISGPPGFAYARLFNCYGQQDTKGIVEETHNRLYRAGHALPHQRPRHRIPGAYTFSYVDPEWWQLMAYDMLQEENVTMLMDPMIMLLICGAFSGIMIISQAASVATNMIGMTAASAAVAVSTLAIFNTAGRIIAGYLSDRIGRINTLAAACTFSIAGLLLLFKSGTGNFGTFYIGISIVGICFGSFMGVFPGFTADQFGPKNNSVNYGIMFIGFAISGYFGPTVMKNIFNATGSYAKAFLAPFCYLISS